MNQENNSQTEENCPLCESSKEAVNSLGKNKDQEIKKQKSAPQKGILFLVVALIIGTFGGYIFLSKPEPGSSIEENNLNLIQTTSQALPGEEKENPRIGSIAPDFVSKDVDGNVVSLRDFRGKKPVLLIFWATWCGYCAQELPDLIAFNNEHGDEVQIIAVASGEAKETIQNYIQEKEINFLMLLDEDRKIWNQYLVRGTPSHFLIDQDGKIVTLKPGLALLNDLETMLTMIR